jgi:anti-sigma28 factor (negative regulator of flagellin synthesis)
MFQAERPMKSCERMSSRHHTRRTLALLRLMAQGPIFDRDVRGIVVISQETKKNKLRCQAFDVGADKMIRALTKRLQSRNPVTTTTTQAHDMPTTLSAEDTGDLYRSVDAEFLSREERVARIKALVQAGKYRPDLTMVASRMLGSALSGRT